MIQPFTIFVTKLHLGTLIKYGNFYKYSNTCKTVIRIWIKHLPYKRASLDLNQSVINKLPSLYPPLLFSIHRTFKERIGNYNTTEPHGKSLKINLLKGYAFWKEQFRVFHFCASSKKNKTPCKTTLHNKFFKRIGNNWALTKPVVMV